MRSKGRINNYIGHRIREIRKARKMTLQEVARRAGIAAGSYSCLENGWYNISLDNLFRILQVLEADVTNVWPVVTSTPGEVISDEFLKLAIREAIDNQPRPIHLDDIFDSVAKAFQLSKRQLQTHSRWRPLVQARGACGVLVQEFPNLDLVSLARSLGYSLASMEQLVTQTHEKLTTDSELAGKLDAARADLLACFTSEGTLRKRGPSEPS